MRRLHCNRWNSSGFEKIKNRVLSCGERDPVNKCDYIWSMIIPTLCVQPVVRRHSDGMEQVVCMGIQGRVKKRVCCKKKEAQHQDSPVYTLPRQMDVVEFDIQHMILCCYKDISISLKRQPMNIKSNICA